MGGGNSILNYIFAWFVKKSSKIIKKSAHTQHVHAEIYAKYILKVIFLRKVI